MAKLFTKNDPAMNITMVGFGQAGSRIADEFAAYTDRNKKPIYNCLALNSNDGDLEGLINIPSDNRVSLGLGGLGKNPTKAMSILEENEEVKDKLKHFITEKIRPEDDLVLFFAGLGGGTGTSTIIKAMEEFYDHYTKPLIAQELLTIRNEVPADDFVANKKRYLSKAIQNAQEKTVKIGVIVTLPLRNEGAEVLKQVNNFAQQIWEIANNPAKGIAFVTFADNQHFNDEFKEISTNNREGIKNYRDYGNKLIADIFHELNTATTVGGADIRLDAEEFRRIVLEGQGSLVLSRLSSPIREIQNSDELVELTKKSIHNSNLHSPIELTDEVGGHKQIHHIGVITALDGNNDFGGGVFLEEVIDYISSEMLLMGTPFSGYINGQNDFLASSYAFYKVDGLPKRLETGLVKEYEEYTNRKRSVTFQKSKIQSIGNIEDDEDTFSDLDLEDLGLNEFFKEEKASDNSSKKEQAADDVLNDLMNQLKL